MPKVIISAGSCPKLCRIANTVTDSHIQQIVTIGTLCTMADKHGWTRTVLEKDSIASQNR